jgi:hypothetical protein
MKPSVRIQHELDMDCRRMPIFVIPQLFLMVYRWRRRGRLKCGVSNFAINETHYRRCSHIEVMQGKPSRKHVLMKERTDKRRWRAKIA